MVGNGRGGRGGILRAGGAILRGMWEGWARARSARGLEERDLINLSKGEAEDTSQTGLEGIKPARCVKTVSSPRKHRTTADTGPPISPKLQLQLHNSASQLPSTDTPHRCSTDLT